MIKRLTTEEFLRFIFRKMKLEGSLKEGIDFEEKKVALDYWLASSYNSEEMSSYEFDTVAEVEFGGCEGVYVNISLVGRWRDNDLEKRELHIGSIKSLDTDITTLRCLGALCGNIVFWGRKLADEMIMRLSPDKEIKEWVRYQQGQGKEKFYFVMKENLMTGEDGYLLTYSSSREYAEKSFAASLYAGSEVKVLNEQEYKASGRHLSCINVWSTK